MVTSLNSHIFSFETLIFPTMSKTKEFGQKTQGILGIKNYGIFYLSAKIWTCSQPLGMEQNMLIFFQNSPKPTQRQLA
jgi:hypothetical protein